MDRRGFLGWIGKGAAAAGAGIASKDKLLAAVPKISREETIKQAAGEFDGRLPILRLAHPISHLVRDGKVKAGDFYIHKYLETEPLSSHSHLYVKSSRFAGHQALLFDSYEPGIAPTVYHSNTEGYKRCVEIQRDGAAKQTAMHGPRYIFDVDGVGEVEYFCGTKSLRKFSDAYLSRMTGSFVLASEYVKGKYAYYYSPYVHEECTDPHSQYEMGPDARFGINCRFSHLNR